MRTQRKLALLFVAFLLPASCSGKGDDGKATATTATTASKGSAAAGGDIENPGSADPAKEGVAKAAIVQASDFPPGWRLQDPQEGLDLEILWQDITRCLGVERKEQPIGFATSPTYLRGLATQARATVEYMPEASAQAIASAFTGPKFKDCATEAFTADVKRNAPEGGVPAGPPALSPLDFPKLGQTTSAIRINAAINLSELQVPIFQDYIVVFDGGTVTRAVFLNPGSAFPPDLQRSLMEKAAARVKG